MSARQIIFAPRSPTKLTPFLRYSYSLLPLFLRVPPFVFNSLQPLFPKTGGWGIPRAAHLRHCTRPLSIFTPLFSWCYELLFPQPLSFHKHLRCPMLFPFVQQNRVSHSQIRNSRRSSAFFASQRYLFSFASSEPFKCSDIPTFSLFSARMLVTL
jgi:hypothetical protein